MTISRNKVFVMISCSIVSLCLFVASAYAASIQINNVTAQKQQNTLWCWAATSSMVAQFLGVSNATQSNIVTAAIGSPYNSSGTIYDMQRGLAKYGVASTPLSTTLTFISIVANVNSGSNPIALIQYNNLNGHTLLVKGYYSTDSLQNLYYIDPADASSNVMGYSTFKANSSWTWIETLASFNRN